jgi:predicted dehydrogenase
MTWLMDGQAPTSVFAVTKRIKPDVYPKVDDEADIVLNYPNAVAIIQGSWNWPFSQKQMDVYGKTGYAKAMNSTAIEVRKKGEDTGVVEQGTTLAAPYDDPLHYLEAVLTGAVDEGNSVSGLKTNVTVSEILDAARRSSLTGKAITLPLLK